MHSNHTSNSADKAYVQPLIERFLLSRRYSTDLLIGLSPEDCQSQSMDDASPTKWHLAHVTWFYEVMVLQQFEENFKFWRSQYAVLFNSYYNSVGDKHPRPKRGLLTRPTLNEVLEWRKNIDNRVVDLLKKSNSDALKWLIEIGINHEQQHQELIKTDLQHLFFSNSLYPAYLKTPLPTSIHNQKIEWIETPNGLQKIGFQGPDFYFDNEGPIHDEYIPSSFIRNTLVTNNEWKGFIEDGGYETSKWWLDEGWSWIQREKIVSPLYWVKSEGKDNYQEFSLNGLLPLEGNEAVRNISYFEADAFARWANVSLPGHETSRLPTEFEWESICKFKGEQLFGLFGQVWQWTNSSYSAYPGYIPWSGMAGEYNGKFMVNQFVLRGSSAFTSPGHSRPSYRNFFPTHARWQMTGLRLARDKA